MALLAVMVARRGFLLHSWRPLSLGTLTHSPFTGASSRALFVCAHSMRRMLVLPLTLASSSGARSQPQSTASRSSTQALRFFLQGTPRWFPFSQLGRSRQADAPLLPIVQEILQSHSLVFRSLPHLRFPPMWCCSGHHSLHAFTPRLRHCPLCFQLLFTCASLLPPAFFRPHVVHLSS